MIHNQRIEPTPAINRQFNSLLGEGKVRHIACEDLDELGAVLVVQLVEGGVRPRDEDEFVVAGEEVVGGC